MKDGGNHGASLAGLSGSDGENGMNGAVDEALRDAFAERDLIGEEWVNSSSRDRKRIKLAEVSLADDKLRKKARKSGGIHNVDIE